MNNYYCPHCYGYHPIGESCKRNSNTLPYEPAKFEPILPPPSPVYDPDRHLIGYYRPVLDNTINTGLGGSGKSLKIEPNGFVRDGMDRLIGQMGPGNILYPPDLPSMPDYGPPQSGPEQWMPGYSPLKPLG